MLNRTTYICLLAMLFAGSVQAQTPWYNQLKCSKTFRDNGFERFQIVDIHSPPLNENPPCLIIGSKCVTYFKLPLYSKVTDLKMISERPRKYEGFYHFPTYGETSDRTGLDRGQYLCGLQLLDESFGNPQKTSCEIKVNNQFPAHYEIKAACKQKTTGKRAEFALTADPQDGRVVVSCNSPDEGEGNSFRDEFTGMSCTLL